jgi:small subunit ribosomal protein S1
MSETFTAALQDVAMEEAEASRANAREHPAEEAEEPTFATLIEQGYGYTRLQRGDVHEARILSTRENEILVDLGGKKDGIIPPDDLRLLDEEVRDSLRVGDKIPVVVVDTRSSSGEIVVSLRQGLDQQDWLRAKEFLESTEICESEVVEANRGGVVVSFGRLRGFVPNSHLSSVPRYVRGDELNRVKSELIGKTLSLAIIEVNQRRRRLVLSERSADGRRRHQLFEELQQGDKLTGVVSSLTDFGAFVDLGGADGLIHISELSWRHVAHPSDVLSIGEKVEVVVLRVDRKRQRIGLSRRQLLPDPWLAVSENLRPGQVVEGTVTAVTDLGAFVEVAEGLEGLARVSEIPDDPSGSASLEPGAPVSVRVLRVDQTRRRIALSLRLTLDDESTPGPG